MVLAFGAPDPAGADVVTALPGPTFVDVDDEMESFAGRLYFAADDGVHGNELWSTDGTQDGTTLVADINPGPPSTRSNPSHFTVVGNRMFFEVLDNGTPAERNAIYYVDASAPSTVVKAKAQLDGSATTETAQGAIFGVSGGNALIGRLQGEHSNANYAVYALGETGDTFTKISNGYDNIDTTNVLSRGASVGGWTYYSGGNFQSGTVDGYELWRTNGATTQKVKDIRPGVTGSDLDGFFATSDRVYFTADDGTHGKELWVSDGSAAGTQLLLDQHPGTTSTGVPYDSLTANGSTLYYVADDPATGAEPWRTEGTTASTRVVKDVTPGTGGNDRAQLFAFKSGFGMLRGNDVFSSDGSDAGTAKLATVANDGYGPLFPLAVGDRAYFRGGFAHVGSVVWRTDGTAAGTLGLSAGAFDAADAVGNPDVGPLAQLGTKLVFSERYPHPAGDTTPAERRRLAVIDTTRADPVRLATSAPSITGTGAVGQRLTGVNGSWTGPHNEYSVQWLRNGSPIANQTGATYTLTSADAGAQVSFRVTATGVGVPNVVSADSGAVAVAGAVTPPALPSKAVPTQIGTTPKPAALKALSVKTKAKLSGRARVGRTLTVKKPSVRVSGVKLAYRWYANGKRIKGATKSKLKLKRAQRGKRITAKVVVTKSGYRTLTLTVGPTAKVAR